jgi:hypothetical protein
MLSAMTIRNTVMLRRVVTPTPVFSPRSAGIKNPKNPTKLSEFFFNLKNKFVSICKDNLDNERLRYQKTWHHHVEQIKQL